MKSGIALLLLALFANEGWTQVAYRSQPLPLWYQTDNPFMLYWARGQDTLGTPYRNVGVERHSWSTRDHQLVNVVTDYTLDTRRIVKEDTFRVSPIGRVLSVRGKGEMNARVDLLMPLPANLDSLRVGFTWSDSLRQDSVGEHGPHHYIVNRRLTVKALEQRGERIVAVVSSTGEVLFRLAFTVDSASRAWVWSEMKGPASETFEFDLTAGHMIARTWSMDLRGIGGVPNGKGGMDTVPSGLRSEQSMRLVTAEHAAKWIRSLPGKDTTVTVSRTGEMLLHVTDRNASSISASMARNDGTVGTARIESRGPGIRHYTALWTGPDTPERSIEMTLAARTIQRAEGETITVPDSVAAYAVADFGMDELLGSAISTLPRDGSEHRIAVFRPFTGQWTRATVSQRDMHGLILVAVSYDGSAAAEYHLYTPDWELLYVERTGQSQRLPRPGNSRRAAVERFLNTVNAGAAPRS